MTTHYIHVTDPPIALRSGETVENQEFVMGGAVYGRFIFTEQFALLATEHVSDVTIRNCVFRRI